MARIAVFTPDPQDASYIGQWPGVLERLEAVLTKTGHVVEATPWTRHASDVSGLMAYDLVLPVIAWGYHRDHARWCSATDLWNRDGVRIANPASVLNWNSDKRYLLCLAVSGIPIPPTRWTDSVSDMDVKQAFAAFSTDQVVVKPTVSAGAFQTLRLSPGEGVTDPPHGPAMIQPYLPTIETEGETSLLFFGGRFSHAVNKRPISGDFRIQVQFGGQYRPVEPTETALAMAQSVLATINEPLLYARIDLAPDTDGRWLLMEAELIEPDFYLSNDPTEGAGFINAVNTWLGA